MSNNKNKKNKVVKRPNRIVKLSRELYNVMDEIAYFNSVSCEELINGILMEIGAEYGKEMMDCAKKNRKTCVRDYLISSNVLKNPLENNKFKSIRV